MTAPNRSTAIRTRLSSDTIKETSVKNGPSLHKASPKPPVMSQEFRCKAEIRRGIKNKGYKMSDMAIFTIRKLMGFLRVRVL